MVDWLIFLYLHDLTDYGTSKTSNRQCEKKAETLDLSLRCGISCNAL